MDGTEQAVNEVLGKTLRHCILALGELRQKATVDALRCFACSSTLFKPVTLQCGHSCCRECVPKAVACRMCTRVIKNEKPLSVNVSLNAIVQKCCPRQTAAREIAVEGDALMQQGVFMDAGVKYVEALEVDPDSCHLAHKSGAAYKVMGIPEAAFNALLHASNTSNLPETHFLLGELYLERRDGERALISFLNCLALDPQNEAATKKARDIVHAMLVNRRNTVAPTNPDQSSFVSVSAPQIEDCVRSLNEMLGEKISAVLEGRTAVPQKVIDKSVLDSSDFECIACCGLYYDPVCTPCGHSFCRDCLERCVDHNHRCAMCKTMIREIFKYQKCMLPIDFTTDHLMKSCVPDAFQKRLEEHQNEVLSLKQSLPIFICTLAFPSLPCVLHIFEPRYRLMMRRAVDVHDGNFGITAPCPEEGFYKVGTILEMQDITFFKDGRSVVTNVGRQRFSVVTHATCDGYCTAKVQYLEDEPVPENEKETVASLLETVYAKSCRWHRNISENRKRLLARNIGEFPSKEEATEKDGPKWMWWIVAALPLNNNLKMIFLKNCQIIQRLRFIDRVLK